MLHKDVMAQDFLCVSMGKDGVSKRNEGREFGTSHTSSIGPVSPVPGSEAADVAKCVLVGSFSSLG